MKRSTLLTSPPPQALASQMSLIRVGSVDKTGKKTLQSKSGDVYMVGQNFLCGEPSFLPFVTQNTYIENGNGTTGGESLVLSPEMVEPARNSAIAPD